jgi:hypothetical protein
MTVKKEFKQLREIFENRNGSAVCINKLISLCKRLPRASGL